MLTENITVLLLAVWHVLDEELVFLKAHTGELFPALLRQMKRENVVGKTMREAEVSTEARESGERPLSSQVGANLALSVGKGDWTLPHVVTVVSSSFNDTHVSVIRLYSVDKMTSE